MKRPIFCLSVFNLQEICPNPPHLFSWHSPVSQPAYFLRIDYWCCAAGPRLPVVHQIMQQIVSKFWTCKFIKRLMSSRAWHGHVKDNLQLLRLLPSILSLISRRSWCWGTQVLNVHREIELFLKLDRSNEFGILNLLSLICWCCRTQILTIHRKIWSRP